jgi:general secretion pathway protein D
LAVARASAAAKDLAAAAAVSAAAALAAVASAAAALAAAASAAAAAAAGGRPRQCKESEVKEDMEDMRKFLPLIGLFVLALGISLPSAAQNGGATEKRFDLTLEQADLSAATQMLASRSGLGLQFVFKPQSEPFGRITLNLRSVSVDEAIKYICDAAGAVCKKDASGIYVIGRKADFPEEPVTNLATPTPAVAAPKIVTKILLKHYHPKEMIGLLYAEEVDRLGDWKALLRFRQMNVQDPVGRGVNAPVIMSTPLATNPSSVEPNPGSVQGDNGINVPGGANQGGRLGGGGGIGGGGQGFGGGGQGFGGQGFGGQGVGGQGGNINLQGGQGFVPDGIDRITYDPTDNSLIVMGTDSAIQELERLISRFDKAPQQVTIKVEFITTSNSNEKSFGIDWLFQRGQVFIGNTPGTQARSGDPFFVNIATGNLTSRIRTLLLEGYGTVVNAPFVRTLNNQPAFILQQVTTSIILSQLVSTGTQVISVPTLVPITIQSGLSVQPRINNDGTIVMTIGPTISEFGQIRRAPDGTEIPDVLIQQVFVTARVKNGETIVIGGLQRKQEANTFQRYPILSDLPFIGTLFKSTRKTLNNQELLVFITPTIVPDEGSGG